MLGANAKPLEERLFARPAGFLVRRGVHPNAVTIAGTALMCALALTLFPLGQLWPGALALGLVATTDALDGTMARLSGSSSSFGAFLDSTLDRVSDAAVLAGLTIYLARQGHPWGVVAGAAAVGAGGIVPYARARAEALGYQAAVGIAERGDRLAVALLGALLTGLGLPWWVLGGALGLVAAASLATVAQRARAVYRQAREAGR
ncbi:MAG: CDP-alcohol phosphatidyltransferase family protein [Bifidobacteriaceae bacterium]|nr:CDP-alcohol phosphatidyltransferase family protein [Bifidobacteriaceae bacterium]